MKLLLLCLQLLRCVVAFVSAALMLGVSVVISAGLGTTCSRIISQIANAL